MPLSDARKKANQKWNAKNKDKTKIYVARSQARKFIKSYATIKDLDELLELIDDRRNELTK